MKRTATLFALFLSLAFSGFARDGFAIVVDPVSYREAKSEIEAYASAIESRNNLKVYTVIDHWGVPDSIRAELLRLHNLKKEPVIGAVMIGDIPVVMLRDGQHMTSAFKMDQKQPRKDSSIPSDRFYDDFSLRFKYIDKDDDAPYFYYSVTSEGAQRTRPDIYSGRIRPTDAGGVSRYQKLRDFLVKAVDAKMNPRPVDQLFYFSGHGYISESKVARIDEKAVFMEHFPALSGRKASIGYLDHTDYNPVKEHLMSELMRPDLDVAVLHHHGSPDMQYLNGVERPYMVNDAKEYIRRNIRQHVYRAYQRGRNADSVKTSLLKRFDLPESWAADALSDSLAVADSLYDAAVDLYVDDFAFYGYRPNVPMVVIDACYCGSFHLDDCIADEYIFQPGGTVAVLANTVNSLQDKWSDRFIGLLDQGGCAGDMARYSTYLESHLIGDPTFRFAPEAGAVDIDHLIAARNPAAWKKLLRKGTPEQQALAIEELHQLGAISSAEILRIYETSPYVVVRLQAMRSSADFADDNFVTLLKLAADDSNELIQRFSVKYMGVCGDERLLPELIKLAIANNTSDRCTFDASQSMQSFPVEKMLEEFERQFDSDGVQYIRKDSVRSVIRKAVASYGRQAANLDTLLVPGSNPKELKMAIRATRNVPIHHLMPKMVEFLRNGADEPTQVMIIEALGWHPTSCRAAEVAAAMKEIASDPKYGAAVREEAAKTYKRLRAE
ncbi:MAG: HEAT repeat domain-containing protein [Bacteroidales bacterium]|nr:HEAT repeat domain-containing protein [Bacteroidales bacterium]